MSDAAERLTQALAGHYSIERELGTGGMATVYLARDVRHDREVALKVLRPELSAVLGAERFLNEIRISARLDHPHILTLIDSGEAGGLLYYVLPYVRGESLRQRIERERQLSVDDAIAIARDVAGALEYAHRQGVVHRDVKPENILLHEGEAVVADFGIALALREAGGSRLTETGLSLGTPQYMSPEQATGDRQLDARSDVYSLAAVLYEMLTGEPPVSGSSVQAVIAKLLTERPTSVRVVRDTVPVKLDQAIMRALAKVPADRYPSAAAFADAVAAGAESGAPAPAFRGRRVLVVGGLMAGVAAIVAAGLVAGARGEAAPLLDPPRRQFTFTGTGAAPAISRDGQRIAYTERECDGGGRCTQAIVWQDRGGAGSVRVAEGLSAVYDLGWSPDSRYVRFLGTDAENRYGVFVVPALGGPLRHHAALSGDFLGTSDSLLLIRPGAGADDEYLAVVTAADGIMRDSIAVDAGDGNFVGIALPSPSGSLLALGIIDGTTQGANFIRLARRDGTPLDSVPAPPRSAFLTWDPAGDAILVSVRDSSAPDAYEIRRIAVSPRRGRLAEESERLLRVTQASGTGFGLSASDRTIAYASGSAEYVTYAVTPAPDPASYSARRRTVSTAMTQAEPSPSGRWISQLQRSGGGGGARWQISLMPFDSGPAVLVGAPQERLWHMEWSPAEDRLFFFVGEGGGARIAEVDPATRRIREIARVTQGGEPRDFEPLSAGGFAWPSADARSVVVREADGSTREVPVPDLDLTGISDSPHGYGLAVVGWRLPLVDSLVIGVLDLATGEFRERYVGVDEGAMISWTPNGDIRAVIRETQTTSVLHILPAGGPPARLGVMPFNAAYRYTPDGSRATASAIERREDVWLIPNFDGRADGGSIDE